MKMTDQPVFNTTGLPPKAKLALKLLRDNPSVSPREALIDADIQTLPSQVFILREAGFDIRGKRLLNPITKTRYIRYSLGDNHADHRVTSRPMPVDRSEPLQGEFDYAIA
ncbi:helix-turn-helix domain-containing protein [Pyruvatibacter sp.]